MRDRNLSVILGLGLAFVSFLAIVWSGVLGFGNTTTFPNASSSILLAVFGGLGLAGGFAIAGIGMGRWRSPRPPMNDLDYTGPGRVSDGHDKSDVV